MKLSCIYECDVLDVLSEVRRSRSSSTFSYQQLMIKETGCLNEWTFGTPKLMGGAGLFSGKPEIDPKQWDNLRGRPNPRDILAELVEPKREMSKMADWIEANANLFKAQDESGYHPRKTYKKLLKYAKKLKTVLSDFGGVDHNQEILDIADWIDANYGESQNQNKPPQENGTLQQCVERLKAIAHKLPIVKRWKYRSVLDM